MSLRKKLVHYWKYLGPGFITGAADDDPSGISTYSIAGAQFGYAGLWILLYILPFMIAVQRMCARIGALSGCGLAANIKRYYPRWLLIVSAVSLVSANVFNIGADVYGMAGALNLVIPIPITLMGILMSAAMILIVIFLRYRQIERLFKWFALTLFVYGIALVMSGPDWMAMLRNTLIPRFIPDKAFVLTMFAVLGTTISPYLFFWQAAEEAEDVDLDRPMVRVCKYRMVKPGVLKAVTRDTNIGMISSNIISFFIMALTASTLFRTNGGMQLGTLREAAQALVPLAGPYTFGLFALGLIASGLLAIPVLAGSAAYVISELMGWPASMDRPFNRAKQFYLVMIAAVAIGMLMPFIGITPMQALFWSAIINGLIAPLLIGLIIHMAHNPKIIGPYKASRLIYALGIGAMLLMLTGTIYVIIS